jgi:hypothetical protein
MLLQISDLFNTIGLSRMTVQRRIADISNNLHGQLQNNAAVFKCYSLAIDENVDVKDTAQLLVFVRGIDDGIQITENVADMCSTYARTAG